MANLRGGSTAGGSTILTTENRGKVVNIYYGTKTGGTIFNTFDDVINDIGNIIEVKGTIFVSLELYIITAILLYSSTEIHCYYGTRQSAVGTLTISSGSTASHNVNLAW